MEKIQLVFLRDRSALDARSKAPADVETILSKCGYSPYYINLYFDQPSYLRIPLVSATLLRLICSIPQKAEICLQYPVSKMFFQWYWLLKKKKIRLTGIIHDLESVRYTGTLSQAEKEQLTCFDSIVAHTSAMKELLVANGIPPERIHLLQLFDYLALPPSPDPLIYRKDFPREICFAGNLGKSMFLPELRRIVGPNLHISLYGVGLSDEVVLSDEICFKGKFSPDDLTLLRGHYGLVWDGDSVSTCTGRIGEYLKINAPHKASLYIAAGIPLIVWRHSAIAPYVLEHHLGIAVDSLLELPERLSSIDLDQYKRYQEAVRVEQSQINRGLHLQNILSATVKE